MCIMWRQGWGNWEKELHKVEMEELIQGMILDQKKKTGESKPLQDLYTFALELG